MLIHGRNLLIYADGTVVAAARTCKISMDVDAEQISKPGSGNNRSYLAGRKGWTVSVTSLIQIAHTRFSLSRTPLRLTFVVRNGSTLTTDRMTGNAIINKSEIAAQKGNLATGTFNFLGTGPLTYQSGVL